MRGNSRIARVVLVGGVLLAAASQPLLAQKISIAPNIGVYVPTTELVKAASGDSSFKQEISLTVGGRVGIHFSKRLGIELTGSYAPSDLKFTRTGLADQNQDANVFTGSGRITYEIVPFSGPVAFQLTGGVGVINRSGAFYAGMSKKTDIAGTFGASTRFRLGKLIRLQLSAENYLYKPKGDIPGFGPSAVKKMQNDIHMALGLGIPLLGLGQLGQ